MDRLGFEWAAMAAVLALLTGCAAEAAPAPTPKTALEACADLQVAVRDFYDVASPNSTLTVLDVTALPEINGFAIPRPSCSFEIRPDPDVVPGDVFTIENFYLDYDETLTQTLSDQLERAGYQRSDPTFMTWSSRWLNQLYTAAVLVYYEGEEPYLKAADGRVLDLSISQG